MNTVKDASKNPNSRHSREGGNPEAINLSSVAEYWVPAFAGMTNF